MPEHGIDAEAGPEGGAAMPDPYSVSPLRHELRTPINHIIGYSELPLAEAEDRQLKPFTSDLKKIHTADKTLLGMQVPNADHRLSLISTAAGGRSVPALR